MEKDEIVKRVRTESDILDELEGVQGMMQGALVMTLRMVERVLGSDDVSTKDLTFLLKTLTEKYKDVDEMKRGLAGDQTRATVNLEKRSRDLLTAAQELVRRSAAVDITPIETEAEEVK